MSEQKPFPTKKINIPHDCVHCNTKSESEGNMVRLAPSDLTDTDLNAVPPKDLGGWVHRECLHEYLFGHKVI